MTVRPEGRSGDEPAGDAAPLVFVEDLDHPELDPEDAHHLTRVLRIRPGGAVTASDGQGAWRRCRLGQGTIEATGPVIEVARPAPLVTIAFALVKGQKPELVVQKLTELGVDTIVPYVAERSVVRWDADRAVANARRLTRVAREAAMQCRRCRMPEVTALHDFAAAAALPGAARADRGGDPVTLATPTVLIGPEGGWSEHERQSDLPVVALGVQVLRAETASIAAAVILTGLRAGLWLPSERTQRAATDNSGYVSWQ